MGLWRIPADLELAERSRWLVRTRLVVLCVTAVLLGLATWFLADMLPIGALWITWAVIFLYNCAFYLVNRHLAGESASPRLHMRLLGAQVGCDMLALSALLHFSGGIENPLSVLYVVLVVVSSGLLRRRASLFYAMLASSMWVGLLLLEASSILPHYNLVGFRLPIRYLQPAHIWAYSVVMTVANLCVSSLVSTIVESARIGETELMQARQSCELRVQELENLTAELRKVDEQRSLFMRVVTHELRAPVAAIKSLLQLILTGYVPQERFLEFVAKAEARAGEELDLIGDLLDLARIRQGLRQPEPDTCHVEAILVDVLDMMQPRFQEQGLHVSVDIAPNLPPVRAAQEHVKQVWTNLVSNAAKYNRPDGDIAVPLWHEGGLVQGCVRDTGIGIAPADQAHLFEDFYRTEEAKRHARQGTGLGLSIVKAILDRYGGRIWVESVYGQGSAFYFALPAMMASS